MRKITCMMYIKEKQQKQELIDWCKEQGMECEITSVKDTVGFFHDSTQIVYFFIKGTTNDYGLLKSRFGKRIYLTGFAEFGNVADCNDHFLKQFEGCIKDMEHARNAEMKANRSFLKFLMPIRDVKTLEYLEHYEGYMNEHQKQMVKDRIAVLKKEDAYFAEEMTEVIKSMDSDVASLRKSSGMTRKQFCEYFDIPYRTVEDWEKKKSMCSSYLYRLMKERLKKDGLIMEEKA